LILFGVQTRLDRVPHDPGALGLLVEHSGDRAGECHGHCREVYPVALGQGSHLEDRHAATVVEMTTFLLVRHGETDWNRENRFQGHADPPLNELGRSQARELATSLARDGIDAVYASPLQRARETAEIIARALALDVGTDPRLMEVDVGSWSGLTRDDVAARFPEAFDRWRAGSHGWAGGETYEELATRVLRALREIAARHPGGTVLVIGHGGTVRSMLAHAARLDLASHRTVVGPTANCSVHRLALRDGDLVGVD
jgi:broad specificity phosphatase PhoE